VVAWVGQQVRGTSYGEEVSSYELADVLTLLLRWVADGGGERGGEIRCGSSRPPEQYTRLGPHGDLYVIRKRSSRR